MLKKTCTTSIVILLLSAVAFGFQEPEAWQTFTSPEGRFSVALPSKPKVEVKDVDSEVGKLSLYTYGCTTSTAHLLASFSDYPKEITDAAQREALLDGVRNGVLQSMKAELVSEEKITIGSSPGRALVMKKTELDREDLVYHWRIYLVGRRLYQLAVVMQKKNSVTPDSGKFLTSFKVLS